MLFDVLCLACQSPMPAAEQQDELEALRAIYADDFEGTRCRNSIKCIENQLTVVFDVELGTGVYRIAVKADITGEDEDARKSPPSSPSSFRPLIPCTPCISL